MSRRAEARARYYCREEARRLGWDANHPQRGGQFLEEQEVVDFFPELRDFLGLRRPDFVVIKENRPVMVIETKNEFENLNDALNDAKNYAMAINNIYPIKIAVGIAGTPDTAIQTRVVYRLGEEWCSLTSNSYQLTQIPTPEEFATALDNDDGTTDVRLPSEDEFFETAISISRMLRTAKINVQIGKEVLGRIDMPEHKSAMKELERGRLLFYVTFKGGKGYLDNEIFIRDVINA